MIRDGQATAYFDNWAGLGAAWMVGDGPRMAEKAVSEMEETDKLLDWAFAEGGFLLDFDQKLAELGLDDVKTWEKRGATWSSGTVYAEVRVQTSSGASVDILFKIAELEQEWKIFEISPYDPNAYE